MPEQMITADRLWDEILKAIVYVMPKQLFPLIQEVYGKEYPPDTPVRLLNTEHSNYLDHPGISLSSNLMDIALLIADTDYYHIECQMHNDKVMVIRMISYDLHYAIEHCVSKDHLTDEMIIRFPHSFILYPDQNSNIPNFLSCRIIFQDGSEHLYQIPTVKVQSYSLEEIHEKHLNLFIPYLLLRLKPSLTSKKHPLTKKELTAFLENIIVILQEDLTNGYLTQQECNDYINLLSRASERIFYHHPNYHKEVERMTKPLIYLPSMQLRDLEAALAESKAALEESKAVLAEKDSEIAMLRAKLAALTGQ
ncbi:MAG: hypothetical protein HDQ96_14725 [Lachnospiraceae bacterium]|nr:hypothetical protein [Lachnospiraceae bacterium]